MPDPRNDQQPMTGDSPSLIFDPVHNNPVPGVATDPYTAPATSTGKRFEYMIHEVDPGNPFPIDHITGIGMEGWKLIMRHEYVVAPEPASIKQGGLRYQFIFMREIPPESFPS